MDLIHSFNQKLPFVELGVIGELLNHIIPDLKFRLEIILLLNNWNCIQNEGLADNMDNILDPFSSIWIGVLSLTKIQTLLKNLPLYNIFNHNLSLPSLDSLLLLFSQSISRFKSYLFLPF